MRFLQEGDINARDSQTSSFPSLEELTEESGSSEDSEAEKKNQRENSHRKRWSSASSASEDSGVMGQEVPTGEPAVLGLLPPQSGSTVLSTEFSPTSLQSVTRQEVLAEELAFRPLAAQSKSSERLQVSEDSGVVGQEIRLVEHASRHQPSRNYRPGIHSVSGSSSGHRQVMSCLHCSKPAERGQVPRAADTDTGEEEEEAELVLCDKCLHRQQERKETIYEIIETEINYGRDLRILKEEFYVPMQTTGLLTQEQLDTVFINLDDLLTVNTQLTEKLRSALHTAAKSLDQDLNFVNIGSIFIDSSTVFLAFENYCINQAQASASLEQLERERELLRIFLQVSQTDNSVLRRMHLKSFLMVPVQRIMKYPLLLNRLYKATPSHHNDKENIRQAREKIEDILGHINAKAKSTTAGSMRIKRKQSEMHRYSLTEKIEVNRVALEVLGWSQKEVSELITSRMWYAQPSDNTWASKRCRNIKFTAVHAVLLTSSQNQNNNNNLMPGQQAAMVLVREKNGKYQPVRDPFLLEKSVVTVDPDCDEVFELQEWGREAYIFKAEDVSETRQWVQHLRQQTNNLGQWRRRRNALPNIMLKNK